MTNIPWKPLLPFFSLMPVIAMLGTGGWSMRFSSDLSVVPSIPSSIQQIYHAASSNKQRSETSYTVSYPDNLNTLAYLERNSHADKPKSIRVTTQLRRHLRTPSTDDHMATTSNIGTQSATIVFVDYLRDHPR